MAKTKALIGFAVTAKLISAFVLATRIVQSLYFLYPESQARSHLLRLYSLVCVGPGQIPPRRPVFSQRGSLKSHVESLRLLLHTPTITEIFGHPFVQEGYYASQRLMETELQTVKTLMRLLVQEHSDLGLHCLSKTICPRI